MGAFVTIWKLISEQSSARRERADERFAKTLDNLGRDKIGLQLSSAVGLRTFLQPVYHAYQDEVFAVALASLKIDLPDAVRDELVRTFELALRSRVREGWHGDSLDLSRAGLRSVDLSGLELGDQVDVAFSDLTHANLRGSRMPRIRGYQVVLDGALASEAD